MSTLPFALQLYTVRDHLEADFPGTLERVKEAGYDAVEVAGFGTYTVPEVRRMLGDAGLRPVSTHVDGNQVIDEPGAVAEIAHDLGVNHVVMSWSPVEPEAWRTLVPKLDASGAALKEAGITFCYHNHAHEFVPIDGQPMLDYLLENTAPEHVSAELDTYWIKEGGQDPAAYIAKYAGRCPLLHCKDMTAGKDHTFAEVGEGVLDWDAIFAAAKQAGVAWYIVEQDLCAGDSVESARISALFMARQ